MANTSPANKKWVDYARNSYGKDELLKEYRVIEDDGSVETYLKK